MNRQQNIGLRARRAPEGHDSWPATLVAVLLILMLLPPIAGYAANNLNTWSLTGSLITGRQDHTATLLPNGAVLVAGGSGTAVGHALASAEIYDPHSGQWTPTGAMRVARRGHTATLLANGMVLVVGGYGNGASAGGPALSPLASAELYNPRTDVWSSTGSMSVPRHAHAATLLPDGRVLVAGGCCHSSTNAADTSAELYDPRTGRWTATGNMTTGRDHHTATLLSDGTVLVTGGCLCSSAELYDPRTGRWTATGNMDRDHQGDTATLLQTGRVLVVGGTGDATADLYDPATRRWTRTGSLALGRYGATATLLTTGQVLVAGGVVTNNNSASAEMYDPRTGLWTPTGELSVARSYQTATLLTTGQVLVAGGGGDRPLASAEIYTPGAGPLVTIGPGSLDFDYQAIGQRGSVRTITLTPAASTPLAIGRITLSGPAAHDFAVTSTCPGNRIAPGMSCAIGVRFTPTATGIRTALLTVTDNAPTSPQSVTVSGIGYRTGPNSWAPAGRVMDDDQRTAAFLLLSGKVLVMGSNAAIYDPATGGWTQTQASSILAAHPATVLLPGGTVLAAGGADSYPSRTSTCDAYPAAGHSADRATEPATRLSGRAALLRRPQMAALNPPPPPLPLCSAAVYDPRTGAWTAIARMRTARRGAAATVLPDGKILVAGGQSACNDSGCTPVASAEVYDPHTGRWTPTGSMTRARPDPTALILPNKTVLVMGDDGTADLYDPRTGRWTATGRMIAARAGYTAMLLPNGTVLVAGGGSGATIVAAAEVYDPRTGRWTPTGRMRQARDLATATLLRTGQVLVAGGLTSSATILASAELYDPPTGRWTAAAGMIAPHGAHTAILLPSGKVLVVGGYGAPGSFYTTAELYTPGPRIVPSGRPPDPGPRL